MAVLLNIEYSMGVKQMEVLNMYYSSGNYEAFARQRNRLTLTVNQLM